ncbi:hypothetical protein TWF106_006041 [Orbilia oligospora]|uniref:Methyltransferase type 12 domain-containing protein n=1 Tax=Orbilia oligospora TaxID=2813651 RepID=A0A6G1LRG2_ORBOL|nr:hypothetical protein TWF788_001804 [Orbilia oligospora]KAF3194638.1 hypothetical protein TWF106_006041 [Orbilia oligospora]KAF3197370.1 hypothetical protein TWF679_003238 [Orbilia oligospora]KAF3200815.1 hypothetical protein TWF191_003529 [Orbilia oligospora]KAF3230471.1 hypothetical protein TWF192_004677 [Orbilia oligospora]
MTEASTARFNSEASSWDQNPDVQSATNSAFNEILRRIPSLSLDNPAKPTVLDLGAGTGLLSLLLSPYTSQILSIDPSPTMISHLSQKLSHKDSPKNITPLCALITSPSDPRLTLPNTNTNSSPQKFDIIISNLVLHHIPNLSEFITLTHGLLTPGGVICLTDFENLGEESRKFHPEGKMDGVERHGLVRKEMEELLVTTGFEDVKVEVGWVMRKQVERWPGEWGHDGNGKRSEREDEEEVCEMDFNFLVVWGRK